MRICVLGLSGFPDSFSAKISRYKSIVKMLSDYGNSVTVINRSLGRRTSNETGKIRVVNSINFNVGSYTIGKYLRKSILFFDFIRLLQIFGLKKIDVIIVYSYSFPSILFYRLYSFIFRAKLVLDYVEKRSQMQDRKGFFGKTINDWLFENIGLSFTDGALVISEFLKKEISGFLKPNKIYKLPPVCDFDLFFKVKVDDSEKYILYCGSVGYKEVIDFVVEAYIAADVHDSFSLYLILSGGSKEIEDIKNSFLDSSSIQIFYSIPYQELISLFNNAICMIIPMRSTIQDEARFPQKITEYLASGRPIISNPNGEISFYFRDQENAIFANDYSVADYSGVLRKIAGNEIDLEEIGRKSLELGNSYFSEKAHFEKLNQFLLSL